MTRVEVFACTLDQMEAFADLMLDYFSRLEAGEPSPVPADLMRCAAASMVLQLRIDAAFSVKRRATHGRESE